MINYIIDVIPYAVVVIFGVLGFLLYRGGLKKYAKQLLLCMVTSAEQTYGGGTGKLKFSAVASKLYEVMPGIFKFIFSEDAIARMIEYAVCEMKELLLSSDSSGIKESEETEK